MVFYGMEKGYEVSQVRTFSLGFYNYCYIIFDKKTREAVIVDPSWELDKIIDKLNQLNVQLKAIFLTHSHYDHVNLVEPLLDMYRPQVYMSKIEIDYYRYRCNNLVELYDMDWINIGAAKFLCIHTPGHTAGGMCYFLPDELFTGDTIFIEGCGLCDTKGGLPEQMFESIQRIKSIIPTHVKVYPSHSYGLPPGQKLQQLLKDNIYFNIDNKEYFINFRMRKRKLRYFI